MTIYANQRTLARPISCSGIGLHSGKPVTLKIKPAPVNHGIQFKRTDLQDSPCIPALFSRVVDTSLATVLGHEGFIVSTIEHLMASFLGLSIDNALVELDAYEVPVMDGSAGEFTSMITAAGIKPQDGPRYAFVIKEPIVLEEDEKSVAIYPSNSFKITYTIDFDHPLIQRQSRSLIVSDETFAKDISKARTFGFLKDIGYLQRFGFAKGGSLENAIVMDKQGIVNDGGLRYEDEFVRHKILDCIGDFSLLGMPVMGHIVIHKSGHFFNHAFLKKFFSKKSSWETHNIDDINDLPDFSSKSLAI
jgi:UDP-3-O-[3-hydroxymyristoyl] N-acetylglucosamine deacetylase